MAQSHYESAILLGGAPVEQELLTRVLQLSPVLFCADGGANTALANGLSPVEVMGDLDSISAETKAKLDCPVRLIEDQNSTDFEKCLAHISAKVLICIGFMGRRLDHSLAAMNALAKFPDTRAVLVGDHDICFLAPQDFALRAQVGDRVSLIPLTSARAKSHGLHWPLDPHEFEPAGQTGSSNRASHEIVRIYDVSGSLLVILPLQFLESVTEALINMPEG